MRFLQSTFASIVLALMGHLTIVAQNASVAEVYDSMTAASETLLTGNINDEERQDLQQLGVVNGYLTALNYMHRAEGRYEEAIEILLRILPDADNELLPRIQRQLPVAWYLEGMELWSVQKYDSALVCLQKAKDGFHENRESIDEIKTWKLMALTREYLYDFVGAMADLRQAGNLALSGHFDSMLISVLIEQYELSEQLGDSEQLLAVAVRMDSLVAATDSQEILFEYCNHYGNVARKQGHFEQAGRWFGKNDTYIRGLDDSHISDKYRHYNNLSNLYISSGKYEEALEYATLGKTIFQKQYDEHEASYYLPYADLAYIYSIMGDSLNCFHNLDTLFMSLNMIDEPRGKQNIYISRAGCYAKFKRYDMALADYKKADEIMAVKYNDNDGGRIRILPLMAGMEHNLGHYEESERLYRLYADKVSELVGGDHLDYIDALGYQANAEAFAGHINAACQDYVTAVSKLKEQIRQTIPYLNAVDREGYWMRVSELIQNMTPFALEAGEFQTDFTKACYDGLIVSKAFLLDTERSTYDLIRSSGTADDLDDYYRIVSMRSKLKELERYGTIYEDSILKLTSSIRKLENQLAGCSRSYGDMTDFMNIDYNEIKGRLHDGDVLIDFTDYVSKTAGRVYAAYLVDSKQKKPILKKLFAESLVDSMQVEYPDQYYESPNAEMMYQLLWAPFAEYVADGATVYYVPSQLLFQIALESIPLEDGTILGDHYHFVRLSSARQVVTLDTQLHFDRTVARSNAVLYGGLLYDMEAEDWEDEVRKYDVPSLFAVRGGDILRGNSIFRPLPGSRSEVDSIERIITLHDLKVESYTDKQGTEESFVCMSGNAPQILHVATHGFFYSPDEAQKIDYLQGYKDAMALSGLVLAGGNAAWLGREVPDGVMDGILTASDIAGLDLGNTEMAVLSACQSGNGQVTAEGLYGLQRAFKKAGVKTLVMSLWNVGDMVCYEFMNLFYANLMDKDNNYNKRKAFDAAKSMIRAKYSEPFYWACFVMLD